LNVAAAALVHERHEVLDLSIEESLEADDAPGESDLVMVAAEIADAVTADESAAPDSSIGRGQA